MNFHAPVTSMTGADGAPRRATALAASCLLHGLLLAAAGFAVLPRMAPRPPALPTSVAVMREAPPDPAPTVRQLPPATTAQPENSEPGVLAALPPASVAAAAPTRTAPMARRAQRATAENAAAPELPRVQAAAHNPPAPEMEKNNLAESALAALEARIRAAVQESVVYPQVSRLMQQTGRAQVRFDYADGAAEAPAIARTSTVAALDEAALNAVRAARMPPPPAVLAGQRLHLLVWVNFSLD